MGEKTYQKKKTILIADDALFMRHILKSILENAGFTVIAEAENGLHALEQYKKYHPNLVMMDITMPETNGVEGVKLIREYDPKAKIIMVSAMSQKIFVQEALESGAMDFAIKPFNRERLLGQVIKALAK